MNKKKKYVHMCGRCQSTEVTFHTVGKEKVGYFCCINCGLHEKIKEQNNECTI